MRNPNSMALGKVAQLPLIYVLIISMRGWDAKSMIGLAGILAACVPLFLAARQNARNSQR